MRSRLVQLLLSATVVGVCVAGAGSGKSDQAGDVSIESAKREFHTLGEATGISSGSQLRLPEISGLQMQMDQQPAGAMIPTQKAALLEKRKKERDENWLLNAMLEQPEDATETDSLEKEQEKLRADPFEQMIAEQLNPAKRDEDEEAKTAEEELLEGLAINPLSAFMAGWVSDQDRALLVPDTERNAGDGFLGGSPVGHTLSRATSYNDISSEAGAFDQGENALEANPYLDFRTPVFEEPVRHVPTQTGPSYNREPVERSTLEPAPPARSVAPASPLIKRGDEEKKYFPQLKRF